ncbi:MAG: hypothetical protein K0R47_4348 [Brevibacillus sp.]|nr:hypothetical protein [Brevibacillus sp.]
MNRVQGQEQLEESVQRQAEFPETGTSLNPMEETWWEASTQSHTGSE